MKRTLLCVLTAMTVMSSCVTALAGPENTNKEVYNGAPNIENVEATVENLYTVGGMTQDHKTIIITRTHDENGIDITDEVKYVDQSTSVFSKSLEVMFANDLTPGYYKATMGTVGTNNAETVFFVVGDFEVDPADKLEVLNEAEAYGTSAGQTWYKKGFSKTITFDEYNSFKSIKLISEDGTRCIGAIQLKNNYTSDGTTPGYKWEKTVLSGDADVTIALQIYAVPENARGFSLYFSTEDAVAQ